ncbi:MAG: hypothetical protein H6659_12935 [Ardenticatenaceae bacterium]|nr:hypothetical protein [Ardenticatenaceae bacterium]
MTPATEAKRKQFQDFIQRVLAPETAVRGVVGIGSLASGHMRADSDFDAIIFLEPFDLYIVPAEAVWQPAEDAFYSIFDPAHKRGGLQFDFVRLPLSQWAASDFVWPEGRRAELSQGWIAYDPDGEVAGLIAQKTTYDDDLRLHRLDEAIVWLDQLLGSDTPEKVWQALGPLVAHDRLQAAYRHLVEALFAYNRQWLVWRNREMNHLLRLNWLPADFAARAATAVTAPDATQAGYLQRVETLRALFKDLLAELIANGDYSYTPIDQAFMRLHEEPGRSWNIEEWNKFRMARKL